MICNVTIKTNHYFNRFESKFFFYIIFLSDVVCVPLTDLAPGNDEIYEEKQESFLTVGNPQDGQVVLYKVGSATDC